MQASSFKKGGDVLVATGSGNIGVSQQLANKYHDDFENLSGGIRYATRCGDISDTEQLANKYVLPKSIVDDCKDQLFGGCESVGLNFGSQRTSFGGN